MRTILKFRWLVLALWLAAAAGLMLSAPNMADLVREKGQITVPDDYPSSVAAQLLDEIGGDGGDASTVLVFHNENGLSPEELDAIRSSLAELNAGAGEPYGITSVMTHFDQAELAPQMVAEDGTTLLALVDVDFADRTPAEAQEALYEATEGIAVDHYFTGGWVISEDVVKSSEEGLKKTEIITVFFILAILFVVFRSAIAPFIPLLTVGLSYVVSQSIVAYLVEYADFPLSNFTQIFMVAVLFGIGTDYCILLISRFKEELAHGAEKTEAIVRTYRTAGRTVLFSGLAVLVGFASISFSTFVLYRSAVAVAVGVAVMLLALSTIVPFFMAVLGKTIFWPARGTLAHGESRIWGAVGSFSLKRPLWALAIIAALAVPFLAAYQNSISFSSLDEIGERYDSVKGFNVIADSFGPGDSLPSTVVVQGGEALDSQEGLAAVEQLSRELAQVDGVKAVRSATRPTGEALSDLQVAEQVETLGSGLGEGGEGLSQIGQGLSEASGALVANGPKLAEAVDGANRLVAGTEELQAGLEQLGAGMKELEQGLRTGAAGAGELTAGMAEAEKSAAQLAAASKELLGSYEQLSGGLGQLSAAYGEIASRQMELADGLKAVDAGLGGLAQKYPELAADEDYLRVKGSVTALQTGAAELSAGLAELNKQLAGVAGGMEQANAGFSQAEAGQSALAEGLGALSAGLGELKQGIEQAAGGQGQIVDRLPELTAGVEQLADGQGQLASGFSELNGQLGELTSGLTASVDGLSQVTEGLSEAQGYLSELSGAPDKQLTGWYIPEEAIQSEEFQTALDVYMSEDRKTAKFDVVLSDNPYLESAMDTTAELEAAAQRALKGTVLEGATVAVGGISSMNHDLRTISDADYSRTVVLMLIGILLILIVLFRSIVMPVYLVLSLMLTYYLSMAITEVIFMRMLGLTGISWAVPFFGFVMLMALGIDYSIFLMDRFKEYRHLPAKEGILLAMKHMGTVIMSAALILGGTFAAMLPSGVMSLLQIATIVLIGLFLYALVMLPLFIPVMVRTFGEANWWPFMKRPEAGAGAGAAHKDAREAAASSSSM